MARDYVELFKHALPRGAAWTRELGSVAHDLYTGLMVEMARIDARAEDLLREMDPSQTVELIDDWERVFGLPDPCYPAPTAIADRQAALVTRVISRGGWSGGPSVPFLTSVLVTIGYLEADILIRRFKWQSANCNSKCDAPLNSAIAGWPFVWEFVITSGDNDVQAQCLMERYALAHLGLMFAFPLMKFEDATFVRASTAVYTDPVLLNQTALASGELGTVYVLHENTELVIFP